VYARRVWDFDIWRLELGGSGRRERLPSNSTRLEHTPQYSPDGNRIAFASDQSGSHEIWVCSADGSGAVKLTSFGGPYLAQPVWSPDSRRLAFAVRLGEHDEIYLLGSEGGKPEHLVRGAGPTWSRDGRWIYFGSVPAETSQVWKVRAAGGSPVQVTKVGGEWGLESVDGRFLYYRLKRAVWRALADGREATQLIPSIYPVDFEVVERGIYFTSASQQPAILFFDFKTGKTETIAEYGEAASNPASDAVGCGLSVSPDRRSLLFSKREDRGVDLMLVENFR
jgi:Tol biopolymer transport system component